MEIKKFNDLGLILQELNATLGYIREIEERSNNTNIYLSLYTKDKPTNFDPTLICNDSAITNRIRKLLLQELKDKKSRLELDFKNL